MGVVKVVWRWLAFSARGEPRPVYHAVKPMPKGAIHDPQWDRACQGKSDETEIDNDGREWCVGCRRALYSPRFAAVVVSDGR